MSVEQIVGLVVALVIMFVGLLGSILPALPSTPLILIAAILHKIYFGAAGVSWVVMTILAILTAISFVLDHVVSAYGAKRFGATWRGVLGAVVGGIVGLFFSLPGLLLGPFIGAAVFELVGRRTLTESSRAGVGATIGLVAAAAAKLLCCAAMIGLFTANVYYRS